MMEHKVRGVAIMTSEISLRLIHELARRRIAVTFLDLAPVQGYVSNLRIDYFSGVEADRAVLHKNGHERIAFVAGRAGAEIKRSPLTGLRKMYVRVGLSPGPVLHGDLRFEGGLSAGSAIAKLSSAAYGGDGSKRSDCGRGNQGFAEFRLPVPQDISVTGFDKTRLAEYSNPSITTVDIHRDMLGKMAADALHELSFKQPGGTGISDSGGVDFGRISSAAPSHHSTTPHLYIRCSRGPDDCDWMEFARVLACEGVLARAKRVSQDP